MSTEAKERELQFESATPVDAEEGRGDGGGAAVTCAACQQAITVDYYDLSGNPFCGTCRAHLLKQVETPQGFGALTRAGLFGIGAAIAGAVLYYAVIAITNFEIGLVAIAIGYMVGYAIRAGARGGGRRFQVLAVALTYLSVSLAYAGLAIGEAMRKPAAGEAAANGTATAAPAADPGADQPSEAAPAAASSGPISTGGALVGLLILIGFSLTIPVMIVFTSLPSGLLSGAIIAFGMMQAWRMTAAPVVEFSGPYKIGSTAATTVG